MKTCNMCGEQKLSSNFYSAGKRSVSSYCKPCYGVRYKRVYSENKERYRTYAREWQRRHAFETRLRKYGLTVHDLIDMFEDQNNQCAICAVDISESEYHIDHDHVTLKVRGLLCERCNLAIGLLGDNINSLKNAIVYLERYK